MKSMPSILSVVLLAAAAACEGEPPKTPATPVGAEPAASTPEPETEAPATPPPAPTPAPCSCCPCAAAAATDGGVGEEGGAAAAAPPVPLAPTPTSFAISGTVTSHAKPLAVAVVYLEDAPIAPDAKMTAWVENKQMAFLPFLTVIPVGGKVTFHNADPFPHNVFSPDAEKFNMGTIAQSGAFVHSFPKAGAYSLLCNLHPGMLGYVVVTPSSYFAKTDAKGHYTIKAVPRGTYKITAWAPRTTPSTSSVSLTDKDATIDLEVQR